jgi:acetyltransferase-like isoleucine patch superfamily enzyme
MGANSIISYDCFLDTRFGIDIEENVMIGHCVKIYTAGHNVDDPEFGANKEHGGLVRINANAVIFPNTLIMPGVSVGSEAVVYPGSVLTKDVPSRAVVGGNPARVLRERNGEIKYRHRGNQWFVNS